MNESELKLVLYKCDLDNDENSKLVVTREANGEAIYRVDGDRVIMLVGWSFEKFQGIEAAIQQWEVENRRSRDNKILRQSPGKPVDELRRIIYKTETIRKQLLIVTREINGYFQFCYNEKLDKPLVFDWFTDPTSAIDGHRARLKNPW